VLDQARVLTLSERVFRVSQSGERWRLLNRLRTTLGDGRELAEALEFLGGEAALGTTDVAARLAESFSAPFRPGRFSAGSYGVLYTARKHRTANKEFAHSAPRSFSPVPGSPYKIQLQLSSCIVQGRAKDVRRLLPDNPWLIADDYAQCQALGAAARAEGLDCLVAPSARDRPRGTTMPIFQASAVSAGRQEGNVIFTVSAGGHTAFRTRFGP
jgi:hypothetical protein